MGPSPAKVQKTSHEQRASTKVNQLPDRALERIFVLGVELVWRSTGPVKKEEDYEDGDLEEDRTDLLSLSERDEFQYDRELLQLMNCAKVCKRWLKLATGHKVWHKLQGQPHFQNSVRELDPALLGKKWNAMFEHVDVILPCQEERGEDIVRKINLAVQANRAHFVLCAPSIDSTQRSVHGAWKIIRPHLQKHAVGIKIEGFPHMRGLTYYHFLGGDPWEKLQKLVVDQCHWVVFHEDVYDACVKWWDEVKIGTALGPLPALKKWTLTARRNAYPGPDIVHMAPHVEELKLVIEHHGKYKMRTKAMERIAVVVNAFLATSKYRTYVTLPLVRIVRKPGPSNICNDECWLQIISHYEDPAYHLMTISEVDEEGAVFEGRMHLSEFVNVGNAEDIVLEKCGPHFAQTSSPEDDYLSESFMQLQHCLRQLIP